MASSHGDLWWWHPGPERPPPGPQCYVWVQDWKMWNCYACRNTNNVLKTADWTQVGSDKHLARANEWAERFGMGREHLDMLLGVPAARTAPAPRPPTTTQPPAGYLTDLTTLLGDGRTLRSPAGQPATPAAPQPTTTTTGPSTTSMNIRFWSCWSDEDYIGKICKLARGTHPRTIAQRTLDRWLANLAVRWR
jgi:hypothetical protein